MMELLIYIPITIFCLQIFHCHNKEFQNALQKDPKVGFLCVFFGQ